MTTPRRRFFRVADAVLREEWDQAQRATFVGLAAWFNQRRARDLRDPLDAQRGTIPPGDLLTITLEETLDAARATLARLVDRLDLTVEERGAFTVVEWPKLANFQGWEIPEPGLVTSRKQPRRRSGKKSDTRETMPPPTPTPTPTPTPGSGGLPSSEVGTTSEASTEHGALGAPRADGKGIEDTDPILPGREHPLAERAKRWANVLGDQPGSVAEKTAYLEHALPLIEAEALADLPRDTRTPAAARAKIRALCIRFWKRHQENPRGPVGSRYADRLKAAVRQVGREEGGG